MVLLKYLKRYSELLFSWGETTLAVQACKLAADACALLTEYHPSASHLSPVYLGANFSNHYHCSLKIVKRDWALSDFLLFSAHSLNYVREVELREHREKS